MKSMEKWTGDIVKKMHLYDIKQSEIAEKIGCSREIVCKTLRGKHSMSNGKERFTSAINAIIADRKQ